MKSKMIAISVILIILTGCDKRKKPVYVDIDDINYEPLSSALIADINYEPVSFALYTSSEDSEDFVVIRVDPNGVLRVETRGNASLDEAAEVFFNKFIKGMCDEYIESRK